MRIFESPLQDVIIIKPAVFADNRGFFTELFCLPKLPEQVRAESWVQDNLSQSAKNVFRGLHFQTGEYAQAKLVTVLSGAALDIIVDLRPSSPTYKQAAAIPLSALELTLIYMPAGVAHGFISQEDNTLFYYKVSNYYSPAHESGIHYSTPLISSIVGNHIDSLIISDKDRALPQFDEAGNPFKHL